MAVRSTETCPQKTAVSDDRPTKVDSALKCVAKCRDHAGAATALYYATGMELRLSVPLLYQLAVDSTFDV